MQPLGRSVRVSSATLAALLAVGIVAGCGSDPEISVPGPNFATIAGGGQRLSFPGTPERANYPNACRLLPDSSVQALLGAPATSTRTPAGCAWSTNAASLPSLTVAFVEIGSDAEETYRQARSAGSTTVSGVGGQNRLYRVGSEDEVTRVDVLKSNVFYRVEVTTATASAPDLATARRIAERAAQLVDAQVS